MISRRDFLKTLGLAAGAAALNGCGRGLQFLDQARDAVGMPSATQLPSETPTQLPSSTPTPTSLAAPTGTPVSPSLPTAAPTDPNLADWFATAAVTPDSRKLCFVLWDHQLEMYGYHPRNLYKPLPETVPLYSGARNRITPAWERYWRGILQICNPWMKPDDFEASWRGLVADSRAFTNQSGLESGNFALHSITCGGATHEMVTGIREREIDGDYMRIYTLNIRKPPPPMPSSPHDIDMTRHFFATTGSNTLLSNGTYAVYGFPQFENCIVPLVSQNDTDLIALSRIKATNRIRSPYNTEPHECFVPFGCTATPHPADTPTP